MQQRFFVILLILASYFGFSQNSEDQAESYYKKGEFKKALIIYQNLQKEKPTSYNYIYKLVDIHQQLEQYDAAEKILVERLEKRQNPAMVIALGYNFQLKDSIKRANTLYEAAITYADEKPNYIYTIARKFEDYSLLDQAIRTYEKGKILTPDKNYNIQLARIYGDQGNVEQMFVNYIEYVDDKPNYLNNIKRAINDFISENRDSENNTYLRRLLLKKIQQEPKAIGTKCSVGCMFKRKHIANLLFKRKHFTNVILKV